MAWDDTFIFKVSKITSAQLNAIITHIKDLTLSDLTDVDISAPAKGDLIKHDGTVFNKFSKGLPGHYLKIKADGTDLEYAAGTAASGDVAHDVIWEAAGDLVIGTGPAASEILTAGAEGTTLKISSGIPAWEVVAAGGDVVGGASSTTNAIARFQGTTGKIIKNGGTTISETGDIDASGNMNIASGKVYKINNTALSASDVSALSTASANSAIRTIWLSGAGGYSPTTDANGGFVTTEFAVSSDSSNNFKGVKFVATTEDTSNNYGVVMPLNWNGGTITATPWFHTTSTGTSGTVIWGVRAGGYDNSDNMTVALGTGVETTFTFSSDLSGKFLKAATTGAITVAGSSTGGEYVHLCVYRKGTDTFAGDVILIGVSITYTTDAYSDV